MTTDIALWPGGRETVAILPGFLRLVCEYEEDVFVDGLRARLYFARSGDSDVLYHWNELDGGPDPSDDQAPYVRATVAAVAPRSGTERQAAARMLGAVWRSQWGTSHPRRYRSGELVSRVVFRRVRGEIEAEWEARRAEAEKHRGAELIRVAEELGLQPQPAGAGPHAWYINCPTGRGHRAQAESKSNQWGCGYCQVRGGPAELREEVARRRAARGARA